MTKSRQPSLYDRLDTCQRQRAELVDTLQAKDRTIAQLRDQLGFVANLDTAAAATVRAYLNRVDTLALLSSANQAIRPDRERVSGSAADRAFDPTPVYAHNLLTRELDHIARRADALAGFIHLRTQIAARSLCRHCHHPIDISWPRHCAWCGHPLSERNPQ
jgi:hypothetical protein